MPGPLAAFFERTPPQARRGHIVPMSFREGFRSLCSAMVFISGEKGRFPSFARLILKMGVDILASRAGLSSFILTVRIKYVEGVEELSVRRCGCTRDRYVGVDCFMVLVLYLVAVMVEVWCVGVEVFVLLLWLVRFSIGQ